MYTDPAKLSRRSVMLTRSMHMLKRFATIWLWFSMFCTHVCLTPVIPNHVLITVTFKCAKPATTKISATFFCLTDCLHCLRGTITQLSHLQLENCFTFAISLVTAEPWCKNYNSSVFGKGNAEPN